MSKGLFRLLINYLIKGIVVLVPLVGALSLVFWAISSVDSALNISGELLSDPTGKPLYIPGLGILSILLVLIFAGFLVTNFVTEPIKLWFVGLMNRIPLFKTLYSSIKDFTEAFVGDDKKFNEPVLVQVNDSGLKKIGFLTQRDLTSIGLKDEVMVYFPYAYSFAGQVGVVKIEQVQHLKMSATDAMKLAVSGGVSGLGTPL